MTNGWIRAVVAGIALYPIAFCAGAQQPAPAPQPGNVAPPAYSTPPNLGTQTTLIQVPSPQPVITITASASNEVANDRMLAMLRAETDNADAARAASEVNARMARALSQAKPASGIDARTTGYSSYQISEPNRPLRWRVSQTLALESGDFVALSALVSKLQGSDGLLLSGLSFTVSASARHAAEDALTTQAIKSWQQRAQNAARKVPGETGSPSSRGASRVVEQRSMENEARATSVQVWTAGNGRCGWKWMTRCSGSRQGIGARTNS